MTNVRAGMKTLPMASMLGLIIFTTVWGFASSAVFTVQPHSLRNHLLEIGKAIQAVAVPPNIAPEALIGEPAIGSANASQQTIRSTIASISAPVTAIVEQLKDPLSIKGFDEPAPSESKAKNKKLSAKAAKATPVKDTGYEKRLGKAKAKAKANGTRGLAGQEPIKAFGSA